MCAIRAQSDSKVYSGTDPFQILWQISATDKKAFEKFQHLQN